MSICHFCWSQIATAELPAHQAAEHPGWSKRWGLEGKSRTLTLIDADGAEHPLTANEVTANYRRLRSYKKGARPVAVPVSDAPAVEPGEAVDSPVPTVRDNAPGLHRIRQMAPPASLVSRGVVEAAFTREFLASTLQEGSRILSEWDGAGAPGTFSAAEAAQIANLVYDPTVSLIIDRFGGRVDRFKMMLAGAIILGGRGRYHVAAIGKRTRDRVEARRAAEARPVETPEREAMHSENGRTEAAVSETDWWAELRARQSRGN
jgi:hypothetical protein